MSCETKHFIGNTEIRPKNADEIGFTIDWTKSPNEAELTVDEIQLEQTAYDAVKDHLNTIGPFEGIPYTVQLIEPGTTPQTFNLEYYVDLNNDPSYTDSQATIKINRRQALNYFKSQADGLSFEALNANQPITNMINMPYVIIRDDQAQVLIMLAITTYQLTKALIEGIRDVVEATTEVIRAATPNAGIPPSVDVGDIIAAALLAIARIAYVIALIIALINIVNQILNILFPPIRYFKGSYISELLTQGCAYLGYNFDSDLFDQMSRLAIMPVPLQDSNNSIFQNLLGIQSQSYTKGYPTANDSTPTLGALIDAVLIWFNAKIRVENGNTVRIERRDYWQLNSGQTIKNTLNIQPIRENGWTYNFGETWKRYYVHYRTDPTDMHTLDKITATDCEYSTEPLSVTNQDLVDIKGLVDIPIPFAFAIRKESLTYVETIALALAQFADTVINTFGGNSNLASQIQGRIGVTQISQQYFTQTKVLWALPNGRQPANYLNYIGANAIYQGWHLINQVKENFKKIQTSRIPFSAQNFLDLLDDNYVYDENGTQIEILTFKWVNETREAEIQYATSASSELTNIQTIQIDG